MPAWLLGLRFGGFFQHRRRSRKEVSFGCSQEYVELVGVRWSGEEERIEFAARFELLLEKKAVREIELQRRWKAVGSCPRNKEEKSEAIMAWSKRAQSAHPRGAFTMRNRIGLQRSRFSVSWGTFVSEREPTQR